MIDEKDAIIILGSSRKDGNTKKIVDFFNTDFNFEVVNLIEKNIGYYDYEYNNQNDDFYGIIDKIIDKKLIIFATPVYWYSMSAPLKTFFDRLSDLIRIRKDAGRKLKGKTIMSISCGSEALDFDFHLPFRKSAEYLYMNYLGDLHGWMPYNENALIPEEVEQNIISFTKKLKEIKL